MTTRALLVDLDGTLADTAAANAAAYQAALAEAGIHASPDAVAAAASGRSWRQFLPPLLAAAGSAADPAAIARRKAQLYPSLLGTVAINTALVGLLAASRGRLASALVTTAARANAEAVLARHGLTALFDLVVTGDDVSRPKPDPEAYRLAAARLGVPPSACLAFEDSDIGVASATAAGVAVLRVRFPALG